MCYKIIKESDLSKMSLTEIEDLVKSIPTKLLGDLRYYDLYQPELPIRIRQNTRYFVIKEWKRHSFQIHKNLFLGGLIL